MSRAARIQLVAARMVDGARADGGALAFPAPTVGRRRAKATEPHYLRLVAGNGQTIAVSELYANKANAKRAVGTWVTAFYDVWSSGLPVVEVQS